MGVELPPMSTSDPRWQAMVAHAEARCIICHPALHPCGLVLGTERRHEGHVGVRFGDARPDTWVVTLDGADCTDCCQEADAVAGWVIAELPNPEVATRSRLVHHGHLITAVLEGTVTVRRLPAGARRLR